MTLSFLPDNAFPIPTPLTPTLVALGLDSKTSATVSQVYISTALSLKKTFEAEYIRACNVFVSTCDDRGHSSEELRSKLLTVAVTRYTQVLSKWKMEGTIEKAAASLRRKQRVLKPKVSEPRWWFQHCVNTPYRWKPPPIFPQRPVASAILYRLNCLLDRRACPPP